MVWITVPPAALHNFERAKGFYYDRVRDLSFAHTPQERAEAMRRLKEAKANMAIETAKIRTNGLFQEMVRAKVQETLAQDTKCIFFANLDCVRSKLVEWIRAEGQEVLSMDGSTNPKNRGEVVAKLSDPAHPTRFGVLSITACGVATTCSPGVTHVVMVEQMWSFGPHAQAEDRVHRINTQRPVFVDYWGVVNSSDRELLDRQAEKRGNMGRVVLGKTEEQKRDENRSFFQSQTAVKLGFGNV
jgi:SNF2 family DNA or RNA helicase